MKHLSIKSPDLIGDAVEVTVTFGDLEFPVVVDNTLAHPAPWAANDLFLQLKDLPTYVLQKIAAHLHLPTSPMDRELFVVLVTGIIQMELYEMTTGKVPDTVRGNHDARLVRYEARLRSLTTDEVTGEPRRQAHVYQATAKLPTDLKGQQAILSRWFFKHKQGSVEEITAGVVKDGLQANQDPKRVVVFYINVWRKKGWIVD